MKKSGIKSGILISCLVILVGLGSVFTKQWLLNKQKEKTIENVANVFDAEDFSEYVSVNEGVFLVSETGFIGTFPVPKKIHVTKVADKITVCLYSPFAYKIEEDDYPYDYILDKNIWTKTSTLKAVAIFTKKYGKIVIPSGTEATIGHQSESKTLEITFTVLLEKEDTKVENVFDAKDFSEYIDVHGGSFLVSENGFRGTFPVPGKIHVSKSERELFVSFSSPFVYMVPVFAGSFEIDQEVWTKRVILQPAVLFTKKYGKIVIPSGTEATIGHQSESKTLEIAFTVNSTSSIPIAEAKDSDSN